LIDKILISLKQKGVFSISYCIFCWENLLKDIIVDNFKKYNVNWNVWNYQNCSNIDLTKCSNSNYSYFEYSVPIIEKYEAATIVNYLLNISMSLNLADKQRENLKQDLLCQFQDKLQSDKIEGETYYYIKGLKKNLF
jgi:hypothetical protein